MWPGGTQSYVSLSHDGPSFRCQVQGFPLKYHFGIIDSHTQRKRYGQVAQIYFGLKKKQTKNKQEQNTVGVRCVYTEELA